MSNRKTNGNVLMVGTFARDSFCLANKPDVDERARGRTGAQYRSNRMRPKNTNCRSRVYDVRSAAENATDGADDGDARTIHVRHGTVSITGHSDAHGFLGSCTTWKTGSSSACSRNDNNYYRAAGVLSPPSPEAAAYRPTRVSLSMFGFFCFIYIVTCRSTGKSIGRVPTRHLITGFQKHKIIIIIKSSYTSESQSRMWTSQLMFFHEFVTVDL